jgi:integrase
MKDGLLTLNGVAALRRRGARGRHFDGFGRYLVIRSPTNAWWELRFALNHKEYYLCLGSAALFNVKEMRKRARPYLQMIADGANPLEAKCAERAEQASKAARQKTFKEVTEEYLKAHGKGWSSKTLRGYEQRMRIHAFPTLGTQPVEKIDRPQVRRALEPVWSAKPQTAIKVQQNVVAVLEFAKDAGYRSGDNPAQNLARLLGAPSKIAPTTHLAAMPYREVPAFVTTLRSQPEVPARALEFCMLTAARSAEVFQATWSEFDLQSAVWIVPSARQKSRRDHGVPLSRQAVALLRALPYEPSGDYVFIGSKVGRPIANDAMLRTLRALRPDVTTHGFRSSFRDWAGERANFPSEVVEQALAHVIGGATARAYFRSDLFERRRALMEAWSDFCCDATPVTAEVTPLLRARA